MAKLSKRMQTVYKNAPDKIQSVLEAVTYLKESSKVKFDESLDVCIKLSIDAKKSDQNVRGAVVMPHGTGKTKRVAVFAQGKYAEQAEKSGADIVGYEDLAASIKEGNTDFDILIATPDSMRLMGQLGPILGPKGLMPNPKVGTVTTEIETAVNNAKSGQVQFKNDKGGLIHCSIGKLSFTPEAIKENLEALLSALKKLKPNNAKGVYLNKIAMSSTMGTSIVIDKNTVIC